MRSSHDIDPEQAVSIAAIILLFGAAILGFRAVLGPLLNGIPPALLPLLLVLASAAGGVGLLRGERWGWPVALAAAALGALINLLALLALSLGALVGLFFDGLAIWLLTRPQVRSRFGF